MQTIPHKIHQDAALWDYRCCQHVKLQYLTQTCFGHQGMGTYSKSSVYCLKPYWFKLHVCSLDPSAVGNLWDVSGDCCGCEGAAWHLGMIGLPLAVVLMKRCLRPPGTTQRNHTAKQPQPIMLPRHILTLRVRVLNAIRPSSLAPKVCYPMSGRCWETLLLQSVLGDDLLC